MLHAHRTWPVEACFLTVMSPCSHMFSKVECIVACFQEPSSGPSMGKPSAHECCNTLTVPFSVRAWQLKIEDRSAEGRQDTASTSHIENPDEPVKLSLRPSGTCDCAGTYMLTCKASTKALTFGSNEMYTKLEIKHCTLQLLKWLHSVQKVSLARRALDKHYFRGMMYYWGMLAQPFIMHVQLFFMVA